MKRLALLALAVFLAPAWADDLGRLFFTPDERALLDLARRTQATAGAGQDPGVGITLNGVVIRSDGRQTVWINGRPQANARARAPGTAFIPLDGKQVRLRVGQTLDPLTGQVREGTPRAAAPAASDAPPVAPPKGATKPRHRGETTATSNPENHEASDWASP
ncbi:hypothetical protein [Thiobacter aerophilum]|uniref:MSHA biogenesis protein MshK n=1 Tax=Thiobacter aerophilum TaxID=3121275 RepID=A0ABV0EG35_9BURK